MVLGGPADAEPADVVTVFGQQPLSTTIFAYCEWLLVGGLVRDIWMTAQEVSQPGDSGAPVIIESVDVVDTAWILGHVVGSSAGIATYVQDINTQLARSGATLP